MIQVDGRIYKVDVLKAELDTEFLFKYAERTEDFELRYELGAVFFNQSLTFGMGKSGTDFADLWDLLSSPSALDTGTGHNVVIWLPIGKMEFLMYPNNIKVELVRDKKQDTWWNNMKVKFIGVKPARRR